MDELLKEKDNLQKEKFELLNKIKNIERKMYNIESDIYSYCEKVNGHKFKTEKELGPYGITFTVCQICGLEF